MVDFGVTDLFLEDKLQQKLRYSHSNSNSVSNSCMKQQTYIDIDISLFVIIQLSILSVLVNYN